MHQSLLKNCLRNLFFRENKAKLRPSLFEEETREIYQTIESMHNEFDADICKVDLIAYWKSKNPSSTESWNTQIENNISAIYNVPELSEEVAPRVIENLWRQHIGLDVVDLGILMSEGKFDAMDRLKQLIERVSIGYLPDEFGEPVTDDIYELLATVSDENRFKFNIETLSREVYGIGRGEFGVIAAYSNVGKTALAVSLCAAPSGFCQQGAKVLYIANEEFGKRTKLRAIQAYTGLTQEEVFADPVGAAARYSGIKDRLIFQDAQGWDISMLEAFIEKQSPDLVIVDMADKIALLDKFNSGHERLRELYYRLRECAKKANGGLGCAVIGVSQASAEAEGKTRLTPTMLEGSKVGKIAECDILIGVGKMNSPDDPDDPTRWITVMKNKISGYHGTVMCRLEGKVSRYVV